MTDRAGVDWSIPATPTGWVGRVERFMGPGRSRPEVAVETIGGTVCAALLVLLVWRTGAHREWSAAQFAVVAVVALDLIGGVLTNSTNAAKRWYHRDLPAAVPGMTRTRMTFIGVHLFHLAVMAFVVLDGARTWLVVNALLLIGCAVAIEMLPLDVKRPGAMAAYMGVLTVNLAFFPQPAVLTWFTTFFFLKLLVCHLVPEAPLGGRRAG